MYKLYTDKTEIFECKVKIDGASLSNSQARLVIESEDLNLLFKGRIDEQGNCKIPIKKLKGILPESIKGEIKLEVIAEDTYFIPWKSEFAVDAAKKVTVEVKSQDADLIIENTPRVSVTEVKNIEPVVKTIDTTESTELNINTVIKEHVVNLMRLLLREDISIDNIVFKKNKANSIISTYLASQKVELTETAKNQIVEGLLNKL
jgi:hypothetical protein